MSYNKLYDIISHPKMDIVINNFWRGPFENEFFMNGSSSYQVILHEFSYTGRYLNYKPKIEDFLWFQNKQNVSNKGSIFWNMFKFKHWLVKLTTQTLFDLKFMRLTTSDWLHNVYTELYL